MGSDSSFKNGSRGVPVAELPGFVKVGVTDGSMDYNAPSPHDAHKVNKMSECIETPQEIDHAER